MDSMDRHAKRGTFTTVSGIVAVMLAVLLLGAGAVEGASTVPFSDMFDDYPEGISLDGTNGWGVTGSGSAIATNDRARLGDVTVSNVFTGEEEAVTITFDVQPRFNEGNPSSLIPADSTYAFYVGTNGLITAFDGETASNLTHDLLSESTATQITVRVDYPAEKWSLWVGSTKVATDFAFYGAAASNFTEAGFIEGSTNAYSYIDNVEIQEAHPRPSAMYATASLTVAETQGTVTATVILSEAHDEEIRVDHYLAGGTALFGQDFTNYTAGTLIFAADDTNKTFTFDVLNDTSGEPPETIIFGLTGYSNCTPAEPTSLAVTIGDDGSDWNLPFYEPFEDRTLGDLDGQNGWRGEDAAAQTNVVSAGNQAGSVNSATGMISHPFGGSQTNVWTDLYIQPVFAADHQNVTNPPADSSFAFYVSTNGQVVAFDGTMPTQLVHYALTEGEWVRFTAHSDYLSTNWSLYLNGLLVAKDLGFYDTAAASYTEFGVRGAGTTKAYIDEVRIQEARPIAIGVSFVTPESEGEESVGVVTATVALSEAVTNEVSVDHFLIGGTADFGADFTNYTPGTLTFSPGQVSTSFTFTVINDTDPDPDETILFGLQNFVNIEAGTHTNFTYTILYEAADEPPPVSFEPPAAEGEESVAVVTATVVLGAASGKEVSLDHFLIGGTADFGADFTNYTPGTLTFPPGQVSTSFTFTVIDDTENESDETIVIGLSNYVNGVAGVETNFTYTILYELADEPPVVSFETSGVRVDAEVPAASIPVVLFPPQSTTVTVAHAILPASTATDGSDYTNYTPGTLTFDPGETNQFITFTVIDDGEDVDEEVVIGLSNFTNASAGLYTEFTYTIAGDSNLWYSLPFVETFELGSPVGLNGHRGWVSGNATVQTDVVYSGNKAAEVNSGLSHTFFGGQSNVWTDMRVRPLLGTPPSVPGNSTFAFYVNTNGHVWAYDGDSARDLTPPVPAISEGQWKRFTVHSDYTDKTWDLYVNGMLMAEDLAFYSDSVTNYSEFGLRSYRTTNAPYSAHLDNVSIGLTRPSGVFDIGTLLLIR